jgi:hypothetical protein
MQKVLQEANIQDAYEDIRPRKIPNGTYGRQSSMQRMVQMGCWLLIDEHQDHI